VLKVGDPAPAFSVQTTDGRNVTLRDLRGKYVVVYFFPKAFTPGCMKEAKRFRDAYPDIHALGGEVLGISVDDHKTQCEFADKMAVTFPMVGDGDKQISAAFGVIRPLLRFDRRVTFLIDKGGVIRGVFEHEFQVSKHLDDVLHMLEKLVKEEHAG
jgi:peroxiredoxin Q/BCP